MCNRIKGIISFIILLISIVKSGEAQSHNGHYLDSLQMVIESANEDTNLVSLLMSSSNELFETNSTLAFQQADRAINLANKLNWKKGEALALLNVAQLYNLNGEFSQSVDAFLSAAKIAEAISDTALLIRAWCETGDSYRMLENFTLAKSYQKQALELARKTGSEEQLLTVLVYLAKLSSDLKEWDDVDIYSSEALPIASRLKKENVKAVVLLTLAQRASYLKQYQNAITLYRQSLEVWQASGNPTYAAFTQAAISGVYANMKVKDSAFYFANEALKLTEQYNLTHIKIDVYQALYYASYQFGDYLKALNYKVVADSLDKVYYSLETAGNTEKIRLKFEQEKKDLITQQQVLRDRNIRNFSIGVLAIMFVFSIIVMRQRNKIKKEKSRSDELLLNILPAETAEELKSTGISKPKAFTMVTVMFTDFKDFTKVSEKVSAELLVDEINYCFSAFDNILHKYKIEKIKTIGDAYMCASGLPVSNLTHAEDMIKCAIEIRDFMMEHKRKKEANGEIAFEIRIGIHTGPVVAGIVGVKKFAYDIWGDTVNIAARMESSGQAGKINISGTTYELVKDMPDSKAGKFKFEYRGEIKAKGKGKVKMYFVEE